MNTLEPGLDDVPFRTVNHDGYATDIRFGGDQVKEFNHRCFRVKHAFVHVDVDDLCTVLNLFPGDLKCLFVVFFANKPGEFCGTGDVGSFTDIHEQGIFINRKRLKAG